MRVTIIPACGLLLAPATAFANEAPRDYPEIIVTGEAQGYLAIDSVTATKIDTPLLETPQTVNVVTAQQIADQAHRSIADVLRYVPGTTIGQGEGNRDQITLRGQNTTADFFVDGVRDDVQYYRNLYNVERVEILKGPYALIFGRGGGGGIINRVLKAPSAAGSFGQASAGVDTFGSWAVQGDVNLPIGARAGARLNAFYEELDNHRDFYSGERFAINPHVAAAFGGGWKGSLSYEYVDDDRVTDRGVPSDRGLPLTGFDQTFFGVPGVNRTGLEAHILKGRLDWEPSEALRWSTTVLYGDYDKFYTNVYANGPVDRATNEVALSGYTDPTTRENFIAQSNLILDFATGAIGHKLLFGLEYGDQQSTNMRRNAVLSNARLDLDNIVYPTVAFPAITRNRRSDVTFFSAYGQDEIALADMLDLIVGLRYDRFEIEGEDLVAGFPFDRTDDKLSPRVGLVFKPIETMSLYASYSKSFLPRSGDQFLALSPTEANLAPERFENFEIGAKWEVRPGLALTAAAFRLDRTNTTTPDPANPATSINIGETRTKGIELGLVGQLMPNWQVSAGYSYQDGYIRGLSSRTLAQVPEHQLAVWNRYDFTPLFGVGLGVTHQSSQFASISNAVRLPAFTRVDAAAYLTVSERFELQLNVENVFDEDYFASAHNDNNIFPGAPLSARLTGRVRF